MRKYIYIFAILLFASSCIKEEAWDEDMSSGAVEVGLDLSLVGECGETKVVVDPEITEETKVTDVIKNFWIIQYGGVDDDAKIVGEPKYYIDMDEFLKPVAEGGMGGKVNLVRSVGKNRIVILANTFDPLMTFPKDSDFAELKKRVRVVTDSESFLSLSGGDSYLLFCGSAETVITENTSISCLLKRNMAKVNIRITNSSSNVTVNSWQIRSVPSISYYFNDYELPTTFPALSDFYSMDYPAITPAEPIEPGASESVEYVVYLPLNKRGDDARVASQKDKNFYAPTNATYFQVNASYDDGFPIQYTFYLGENLTTDFNILPNRSYSYEFNITAKGDADVDSRVKELGVVDFTNSELANCYILNPAQTDGVRRKFLIPVKRADDFWGGKGYENQPNYTLGSNKDWTVKIIACNIDNSDDKVVLTKNTGKGSDDYFEVSVNPGTVGNVVVALYAGDQQVLWSWHLWITDYTPDEAYKKTPQQGVYSYSVTGGVVHRYAGTFWETGEYAKRFIMDRNLGAWNTSYPEKGNGTGTIYFQYGRKDPFFSINSVGFSGVFGTIAYENMDPALTVEYSIHNPLTFISTASRCAWTSGNMYNPDSGDFNIVWQDPYTSSVFTPDPIAKSIFDPCPAGYCVAKNSTFGDFRAQQTAKPTTNINPAETMLRGFMLFDSTNKGLYYWPYPSSGEAEIPSEPVYYPATGVIQNNGLTTYYGQGIAVYMHSDRAVNLNNPWFYNATVSSLGGNTGLGRAHGGQVRCVTVRDVE